MPLVFRIRPAGHFGQAPLDPERTLYVRRRISRGNAPALLPGQVFDAKAVTAQRLRMLYRARFISHELPKVPALEQSVAAALTRGAAPQDLADPKPAPAAKPAPSPRPRARS